MPRRARRRRRHALRQRDAAALPRTLPVCRHTPRRLQHSVVMMVRPQASAAQAKAGAMFSAQRQRRLF